MSRSGSYEPIASEYYDLRHVTSRNFDEATLAFSRRHQFPIPPSGLVLEVGAGRGGAARYCGVSPSRVVQVDISQTMLISVPREPSWGKIRADAQRMPFRGETFSVVSAFLFDPFNLPPFYREIDFVSGREAIFIGSLPHHEWGTALRKLRNYTIHEAKFLSTNGSWEELPSFLSTWNEISARLKEANLDLIHSYELTLPRESMSISPDILDVATLKKVDVYDLPVVQLFVAARR